MADKARSLELKAEGNTLFVKQNYLAAFRKYTDAIKHDEKNAVLYANRAACSIGMTKYHDAVEDAQTATDIDLGYAKAWARLAAAHAALAQYDTSITFWHRALGALPIENLTAGELKQKQLYEAELKTVSARSGEGLS